MKPQETVVGSDNQKRKLLPKFLKYSVFTILVLLVAGGVIFGLYQTGFVGAGQCAGRASSPIYDEAAETIAEPSQKEFSDLVKKIKEQRNFSKDPNCVYPLLEYSIYQRDIEDTKQYLKDLNSITEEKDQLAEAYSSNGDSLTVAEINSKTKVFIEEKKAGFESIYFEVPTE